MATSGVTTFNLTVQEIVDLALVDLGALPVGETPTTAEMNDAIRRLNLVLLTLMNEGTDIYKVEESELTLSDGTALYDTDSGTRFVLEATITVDEVITPLNVITDGNQFVIPTPEAEGTPENMYVRYNVNPPKVGFYPVPDGTYTVNYRRMIQYDSITAASETIDLPPTALNMVTKGLAYMLANSYQLPIEERTLLAAEFREARVKYLANSMARRGTEVVIPKNIVMV